MNRPQRLRCRGLHPRCRCRASRRRLHLSYPECIAMNRTAACAALLLTCLLGVASAEARVRTVTDPNLPRALPAEGPVSVKWTDPNQFTEIRYSGNRFESQQGDWVTDLADYFRTSAAKQLPAGDRLDITITDIKRAGEYEPWHGPRGHDIRVVKDIYPPRIRFNYVWTGANGQVIEQGEKRLIDSAFLTSTLQINDSDQLRYEKRMIDDWTRGQFRDAKTTAGR